MCILRDVCVVGGKLTYYIDFLLDAASPSNMRASALERKKERIVPGQGATDNYKSSNGPDVRGMYYSGGRGAKDGILSKLSARQRLATCVIALCPE
jgi:hypothetical protein